MRKHPALRHHERKFTMQSYPTPSELHAQFPRFWSKVAFPQDLSQCWLWHSGTFASGYGRFKVGGRKGRNMRVHRFSYMMITGQIPSGLELDHLCRTILCVNPSHLEPVTHAENMKRARGLTVSSNHPNRRKTHCPKGHAYSPDNCYLSKIGWRTCRQCTLAGQKRRRMANA